MQWRKSSYSDTGQTTCVEVARAGSRLIATRDSKNPDGPRLRFDQVEWARLIEQVKKGDLDL